MLAALTGASSPEHSTGTSSLSSILSQHSKLPDLLPPWATGPAGALLPEQDVSASSPSVGEASSENFEGLELENPLAVLAHLSIEDSDETPSGSPEEEPDSWLRRSHKFYNTGLYQARQEDPALDPIELGIITQKDLDRLVSLYFAKVRLPARLPQPHQISLMQDLPAAPTFPLYDHSRGNEDQS